MPNLPSSATTKRVRVWRRLQAVGAVAVRPSVYVLPAREACLETFQWLAKEILELGGQAALCEGTFLDGLTDDEVERKFREARAEDYTTVGKDLGALAHAYKAKRLSAEKASALELQLTKLRKRIEEIVAIDFCDAPGRDGVVSLLSATERSAEARRERSGAMPAKEVPGLGRAPRPRGATWVTRTSVHVDRVACAWLILRFIDPAATLKFVAAKGYVPQPGELRFDMFDAEFTHVGDRCSFEVLVARMGLTEPGLLPIAEIIHDIDVRDAKFGRPEVAGVESQIAGICLAHRDDLERVAAATPMFDALYAFFAHRSHRH